MRQASPWHRAERAKAFLDGWHAPSVYSALKVLTSHIPPPHTHTLNGCAHMPGASSLQWLRRRSHVAQVDRSGWNASGGATNKVIGGVSGGSAWLMCAIPPHLSLLSPPPPTHIYAKPTKFRETPSPDAHQHILVKLISLRTLKSSMILLQALWLVPIRACSDTETEPENKRRMRYSVVQPIKADSTTAACDGPLFGGVCAGRRF